MFRDSRGGGLRCARQVIVATRWRSTVQSSTGAAAAAALPANRDIVCSTGQMPEEPAQREVTVKGRSSVVFATR
jgi:hypothetical protein